MEQTPASDAATVHRASQAKAAPQNANDEAKLPSIEDDVKQLAGNISSWWSSFSQASQKQLNDVRARVDAQGGLVSMAKREAARFEQQLNDAQEAARKSVEAQSDQTSGDDKKGHSRRLSAIDIDGWGTVGAVGADDGQTAPSFSSARKGKGKQQEDPHQADEGDEGAAVERLQERTQLAQQTARQTGGGALTSSRSTESANALFDAEDDPHDFDEQDNDNNDRPGAEFKVIEDVAQNAMHSMQSFWERFQTDERVGKLQASVAKTLQNITIPVTTTSASSHESAAGQADDQDHTAKDSAHQSIALPDLSKQFQSAFPNLDWKQSQTMAKRYFEASQSAARDWSKEMGTLMSDLVHVVPPPSSSASPAMDKKPDLKESATSKTQSTTGITAPAVAMPTSTTEEDDFDWDTELDAGMGGVSGGLETTTGPQTTSWEDADPHGLASRVQAVSEADEANDKRHESRAKAVEKTNKDHEDDEDDSDWE